MNITVDDITIEPLFMSRDGRTQKSYYKINENWGFLESTIFPKPFDFEGKIKITYSVWRGDSKLTHPLGNIVCDPYTGKPHYVEFKNAEHALEFCLQIMDE